jgi:hypothetical protein
MPRQAQALPDNPRVALAEYINELEREYQSWYNRATDFHKTMLVVGEWVAIVAGASTAAIAGLSGDSLPSLRWLLVVLPLVGAFATALLTQTRVRGMLAVRERGREQFQRLISTAKAEFAAAAAAANNGLLTDLHERLAAEVSDIEKTQALGMLAIVPRHGKE